MENRGKGKGKQEHPPPPPLPRSRWRHRTGWATEGDKNNKKEKRKNENINTRSTLEKEELPKTKKEWRKVTTRESNDVEMSQRSNPGLKFHIDHPLLHQMVLSHDPISSSPGCHPGELLPVYKEVKKPPYEKPLLFPHQKLSPSLPQPRHPSHMSAQVPSTCHEFLQNCRDRGESVVSQKRVWEKENPNPTKSAPPFIFRKNNLFPWFTFSRIEYLINGCPYH